MRAFLHGFGLGPSMWSSMTNRRDHTPCIPGHQGRDLGAADWTGVVSALAAALDDGSHLIGYSLGGRLALAIALEHPERVARLTLLSCHAGLADPTVRAARRRRDDELATDIATRGLAWFHDYWQSLPMWRSQSRCEPAALSALRQLRLGNRPESLADALRALGPGSMPDYWPRLGELTAATEILAGGLDGKYVALGQQMAARMPHARFTEVPGTGHNLVLEAPALIRSTVDRTCEAVAS